MYMQLRSFIFCCAFGFCFVGLVQADELKQLQTRLQSGQADVAEILKDVNVYLQRSPNDFQALFLKARILERTGNIVDAKQILQELIKARPESVAAYNNLARLYLAEGDLVQAQLLLEQAMRTHTGYATVYENLNQVYAARAKESYGKALQLKSSQPQLKLVELDAGSQPLTKPKKQIQLADNSNIKKQQTSTNKQQATNKRQQTSSK